MVTKYMYTALNFSDNLQLGRLITFVMYVWQCLVWHQIEAKAMQNHDKRLLVVKGLSTHYRNSTNFKIEMRCGLINRFFFPQD